MDISSTYIKDYLLEKFSNYTETSSEFIVDSLFAEDSKKHMSINLETGLWQCFKSKERGNFIRLVSVLEDISYSEASVFLQKKLFDTPEKLFYDPSRKIETQKTIGESQISKEIKNFRRLSPQSVTSSSLPEKLAYRFAIARKIDPTKLYVATAGKYINRLIIPYEDSKGMYYFQARQLTGDGMKYLNPSFKEHGVKSSEILYPFKESDSYVLVTEGPIDALSLQNIGVNATSTQGSMFSYAQLEYLKGKTIILAYDNDDAGKEGMQKAFRMIRAKNLKMPYIVQPPSKFKDWNDFVICASPSQVRAHVSENVRKMDYTYDISVLLQ